MNRIGEVALCARYATTRAMITQQSAASPNANERESRRGLFRATPWHQDNGVVTAAADETNMLTVWFSITDAPVEACCLQIIPGSHRAGLLCHCPDANGELTIPQRLLPPQHWNRWRAEAEACA